MAALKSVESPAPERILIRGVNWLGDAVMTTPALLRLREARPAAHVSLLTHEKLADLWLHHPAIDDVYLFTDDDTPWSVVKPLIKGGFDLALVLPNSPRSAFEVWLAGVPERVGYACSWRRWWLTRALPRGPNWVRMRKRRRVEIQRRIAAGTPRETYPTQAHQMHHYLRLVAALGADPTPMPPRLVLSEFERVQQREQLLRDLNGRAGQPRSWLALCPGAEYGPAKRWSAASFSAVAREVSRQTDCGWLILGGPKDRPVATEIAAAVPTALDHCGRTTLRELMIALSACRLLLTNDTGPMHLAAALGTPVVALFGSTAPELTGPGLPGDGRHRLVVGPASCAPCFLRECPIDFRCLSQVAVERVVEAVRAAFGSG